MGGSAVAAEIAGYFELAVGAGVDMSWANVTAHDVQTMLPLIVYQHNVWMRASPSPAWSLEFIGAHPA